VTGPTRRAVLTGAAALAACQPRQAPDETLRVAIPNAPDSLDPFRGQFASSALIYRQIHAPLEGYRDGRGLAARWDADESLTRWRCTLREGLVWSDGSPLTAADILWSLRHGADPATGWPDIGDLAPISGARAIAAGEAAPDSLGASLADPLTLDFTLAAPSAEFPNAMREFYPVSPRALAAHGRDWTKPEAFVGAGPYVPASESQLSLGLARNARHHRAGESAIATISVAVAEDAGARVRLFRAGDLDLAQDPPANRLAELADLLGPQVRAYPAPRLVYLKVNHDRPALADAHVRRALHLAIDRRFIAEQVARGGARPATTVSPAARAALDASPGEAQRARARQLMADAGYGADNPLRLSLMHSGGERARFAVAMADDWSRIFVETAIDGGEAAGMYAAVEEGRFDLAIARFDRGLRDAPWRYFEPFEPGGFAANFGWEDARLAELARAIQASPDAARRAALIGEMESLTTGDAHVIPVIFEAAAWLVAPRVAGAEDAPPIFWADLSLAG